MDTPVSGTNSGQLGGHSLPAERLLKSDGSHENRET